MQLHWFHPAVVVETERIGGSFVVTSVEKAVEFLTIWEEIGGPKWKAADLACRSAVKGAGTVSAAREAFQEAARECGRLIG